MSTHACGWRNDLIEELEKKGGQEQVSDTKEEVSVPIGEAEGFRGEECYIDQEPVDPQEAVPQY